MQAIKLIRSISLSALLLVVAVPLSASADTPMVRTKPVIDHLAQIQARHPHHHVTAAAHRAHAKSLHSATKPTQLPPHD